MTLCLLLLKLGGRSVTKERGQSGILSAAGHVGFSSSFVNCCLVLSASLAVSHSTSTALFLCISPSSHHTPALVNISIIFSNFGETTLAVKHKVKTIYSSTTNFLYHSFLYPDDNWPVIGYLFKAIIFFDYKLCVYKLFLCPWHQRIPFVVYFPMWPYNFLPILHVYKMTLQMVYLTIFEISNNSICL